MVFAFTKKLFKRKMHFASMLIQALDVLTIMVYLNFDRFLFFPVGKVGTGPQARKRGTDNAHFILKSEKQK